MNRIRAVLAIALCLSLFVPNIAVSGPDISYRYWLEYPHVSTSGGPFVPIPRTEFIDATAVASSDEWALLGSAPIRYEIVAGLCGGAPTICFDRVDIFANPVYLIGPWDGSASDTIEILPPFNPIGVAEFGAALDISGTRVAISSTALVSATEITWIEGSVYPAVTPEGRGRVHLYQIGSGTPVLERTIIFGVFGGVPERFGAALSLDASHMLVGRPGALPGAADLFDPATGNFIATLLSPGGADGYGTVVALADDLALVAAPDANTVYVYRHDGAGNWNAAGTLDSPGTGSEFGSAIAAENDRIIVGAPGIDRAFIYEDDGDALWPVDTELSGGATSRFGAAVALTGDTVFVSAPQLFNFGIRAGLVARHDRGDGSWPATDFSVSRQSLDGNNYGTLISASSTMLTVVEAGDGTAQADEYNILTSTDLIWDPDGDNLILQLDNCPNTSNASQADLDDDGVGDACDGDIDGDGLSNDDENTIGSDPFNPDTDGDGLLDNVDPDPLLSDLDHDGLNDVDEAIAGTDPFNPDTDDDGLEDGDDFFPLDPLDGWLEIEELDVVHKRVELGDNDVMLIQHDDSSFETLTRTETGWQTSPGPLLNGAPLPEILGFIFEGSRAVFLEQGSGVFLHVFHVYDYDAGWIHRGSGNVLTTVGGFVGLRDITSDGNIVAVKVIKNQEFQLLIFELDNSLLQPVTTFSPSPFGNARMIASGDTLFIPQSTADGAGKMMVFEPANNYAPIEAHRPDGTSNANDGLGGSLSRMAPNEILAGSSNAGAFWVSKKGGTWEVEATGIPKQITWGLVSNFWLGGGENRDIVINYSIYDLVYHGLTQTLIAELPRDVTGGFQTNGEIFVRNSSSTNEIDIYHPDIPQPPGC